MNLQPCLNSSCPSYGTVHPNCRCHPGMAEGGEITSFCSTNRKHLKGCEYYAEGGDVEHPETVLGHHAAAKGLLGLLKDAGRSNMQDPEKHHKVFNDAKEHRAALASDPDMAKPRSMGGKLSQHLLTGDHEAAADTLNGHPLTGLVGKGHLKESMAHLAEPMMNQDSHPTAFRSSIDYLSNSFRGRDSLDKNVKNLLSGKGRLVEHNPKSTEDLKQFVDATTANPDSLLNVGGDLGHYLPDHGAQLAATASAAVEYLSSIKPLNSQSAPLDPVLKPSRSAVLAYDRQVSIAQNPMLVLQHAKDGTLLPTDIATMQTIYPKLYQNVVSKIGQQVIEDTSKGTKIPYKMRSSLSMLLGQPLDSTMSQSAMQAIIQSAAPKAPPQGKPAPATTLKAADKANAMTQTPLQKREITKKP